jgi:hypothetical protein
MPTIEIDALMTEFSQERLRIWKHIVNEYKDGPSFNSFILSSITHFREEIITTVTVNYIFNLKKKLTKIRNIKN